MVSKESPQQTQNIFSFFNSMPGSIIIGATMISLSILVSSSVIKIKGFNAGSPGTGTAALAPLASTSPIAAAPDTPTGPVKASVDDDPVLGDKNAPVTIIEFSDYECPFCKRHFDQTLPELVKNYIDTGKVKLVYRDLPLSFHDPMATKEANAANCARDQGGDETYFKFHDEIFKRTVSNGNGLDDIKVNTIATDLGLNIADFKSCYDSLKYKDEISKDLADAGTAGATGTPSFVIGKSTGSGEVEGQLMVGAQPYGAFKTIIDELLK